MVNPLVSVIIPAYNVRNVIVDALDSVYAQTYRPIEVIVIDDGSTDDSSGIINTYKKSICKSSSHDDLLYIHQKNAGPSRARNTGINAATGEYIAFLDADDLWMQDKLEKQMEIFRKSPSLDIVFSDVKITRLKRGNVEEFTVFAKKGLNKKFMGHDFIVMNPLEKLIRLNFMPTPSVVAKKKCFQTGTYFNEKRYHVEDWELWLTMSLYYKFGYVSDVCVHVREMGDGLSSDEPKMTLSSIDVFDSFITSKRNEIDRLKLNNRLLTKCIKEEYKWMGYYLMRNGNKDRARLLYRKSLREDFDMKTVIYYLLSYVK